MDALNELELGILNFIQNYLTCPALDWFFKIYTHLGTGGICCILLGIVLICIPKTRKIGLGVGFALIIGTLVTNITLKPLIDRTRPYLMDAAMRTIGGEGGKLPLLIGAETDASFPSGHTCACIETAFAIFLYNKKWGSVGLGMALLVAYSRLYLYVHYLTDVLGGMVVGIAAAVVAYFLNEYMWKKVWPKFMKEDPPLDVIKQLWRNFIKAMKQLFNRKKKESK